MGRRRWSRTARALISRRPNPYASFHLIGPVGGYGAARIVQLFEVGGPENLGVPVLPRPVAIGLAVLVALMWSVNLIVGYLYPGRSDPYVSAIFGAIVSAVFVLARARRRNGNEIEGDDSSEDEENR